MKDERPTPRRTTLEQALRLFTEVRSGEGASAVRLLASLFALVAANAFVKPARDGFLAAESIAGISEMELKAYTSFAQALVFFALVPGWSALSARLARGPLVRRVTNGFAVMLVGFWSLRPGLLFEDVPFFGIAFYLWVGVFNVFAVSQFWVFGADLHPPEQGKRLFPLIAIGATAGAAAGSWIARALLRTGLVDTYGLLLVAAALVAASVVLLGRAEQASGRKTATTRPWVVAEPTMNAIRLVLARRGLRAFAIVVLLVNWVKANSDNLLFAVVQEVLRDEAVARSLGEDFLRDGTTAFYAGFFFWVNLGSLVLQAFVASRLLRLGGFRLLFLVLPTVSLLGYSALIVVPTLVVFRLVKIVEDATNYSIQNTATHVFWLPTSRIAKVRAKPAVDTLVVRAADGLAALTALVGVQLLELAPVSFFAWNLALVGAWFAATRIAAREHDRLDRAAAARATRPGSGG